MQALVTLSFSPWNIPSVYYICPYLSSASMSKPPSRWTPGWAPSTSTEVKLSCPLFQPICCKDFWVASRTSSFTCIDRYFRFWTFGLLCPRYFSTRKNCAFCHNTYINFNSYYSSLAWIHTHTHMYICLYIYVCLYICMYIFRT